MNADIEHVLMEFTAGLGGCHGAITVARHDGNAAAVEAAMLSGMRDCLQVVFDALGSCRGNRPNVMPSTWPDLRLLMGGMLRRLAEQLEGE